MGWGKVNALTLWNGTNRIAEMKGYEEFTDCQNRTKKEKGFEINNWFDWKLKRSKLP